MKPESLFFEIVWDLLVSRMKHLDSSCKTEGKESGSRELACTVQAADVGQVAYRFTLDTGPEGLVWLHSSLAFPLKVSPSRRLETLAMLNGINRTLTMSLLSMRPADGTLFVELRQVLGEPPTDEWLKVVLKEPLDIVKKYHPLFKNWLKTL